VQLHVKLLEQTHGIPAVHWHGLLLVQVHDLPVVQAHGALGVQPVPFSPEPVVHVPDLAVSESCEPG
jgi:hypothetical protein